MRGHKACSMARDASTRHRRDPAGPRHRRRSGRSRSEPLRQGCHRGRVQSGPTSPSSGGDTGWFPSGFVAQLRLQAHVLGHTAVSAGYDAQGCWQDSMKGSLAGTAGSGYFDVSYGADLTLSARIHTSVLGKSINWEGDIPLPWIPSDLLIADTTAFDPRLATTVAAQVSDSTQPVNVLSTDVIGNFISIPGISGGLYVSVKGSMTSSFRAKTTRVAGTVVDALEDLVSIARPSAGFHSMLEMPVTVDGVVHYAPKLTFAAGFNVKILGIQVVNWDIASISMSLPAIDRNLRLDGAPAQLLLPEMDGVGEGARMDFAAANTQSLHVKNTGQGTLEVLPANVPAGITVSPLTLAPGTAGDLTVTAAAGALAAPANLSLQTNDPDRPRSTSSSACRTGARTPAWKGKSASPTAVARPAPARAQA